MAHVCKRCGSQAEGQDVTVIDPRVVIGPARYDHAQALDRNNDPNISSDTFLTEAEKMLYSRSEADRTYCNGCYYLYRDKGLNVWQTSDINASPDTQYVTGSASRDEGS